MQLATTHTPVIVFFPLVWLLIEYHVMVGYLSAYVKLAGVGLNVCECAGKAESHP